MSIERIGAGPRMSKAVVHGDTVYISGQVAKETADKSVTDQTTEILGILDIIMAEAGTEKSKVLMANIWLSDISKFQEMNAVWDKWVIAGSAPCRATVEAKLSAPKFTVEIALVASK